MASSHCKQLLALSRCAREIQARFLSRYPEWRSSILDKTMVLHPPQAALIPDYGAKPLAADFIDLAIVGHKFFIKGGGELTRVVDRLIERGAPLRLHIVSRLEGGDHATGAGPEERAQILRLIEKHPGRIIHFEKLPNEAVLSMFKRCHLGVLTSWADTYGYSVLEGQAAGCSTLCTNVRALPELVPAEAGWTVNVPVDEIGVPQIRGTAQRRIFSSVLERGIERELEQILNAPDQLERKGQNALTRIRKQHCPRRYRQALESVYASALA